MPSDRDPGDHEGEGEVDGDEPHRLPAEDVDPPRLEDERCAHETPDRARRSHRERVRRPDERAGGPGEPGDDVEQRVAPVPEVVLERGPDEPEHEHVHPEVQEPVMEKGRRDEAPPLAVADERAEENPVLVDPVARPVDLAAEQELEKEHADVDPDQRERDERAVLREGACRAARCGDGRSLPRGCAGVVGAADADRPERHAVGADSASAVGARDVRLAVRMAIAAKSFGHGGLAYPRACRRRVHSGRGRRGPDRDRHRRHPRDVDDLPGARRRLRARALHRRGRRRQVAA